MAPLPETDPEPWACYCNDCKDFRLHYEGLRELQRRHSGDADVGIPLKASRLNLKQAWIAHQDRYKHMFVPDPAAGDRYEYDSSYDSDRTEDFIEPKPLRQQYTQGLSTDPTHWDNGGHHGKFAVCDHCHAHSLTCNEASVCDQCELYGQPCIHRTCRLSDFKEDCPNPECRYVHPGSVAPRVFNDPSWLTLPGSLTGYRQCGFLLNKPLEDLTEPHSYERLTLLQSVQVEAREAATAAADSGTPFGSYRHGCNCTPVEYDDEDAEDDAEQLDYESDVNDQDSQDGEAVDNLGFGFHFDEAGNALCSDCGSTESNFWAVTPCNIRICFECVMGEMLLDRNVTHHCEEGHYPPWLIIESSEMRWDDIPTYYQVDTDEELYAETELIRDHTMDELERKRVEIGV